MKPFSTPTITDAGSLEQLTLGSQTVSFTPDFLVNGGTRFPAGPNGQPAPFATS